MGLGHRRHTKVDTVCSMAWALEARGTQLELSARMGAVFDASLEEMVPGWVQPA